MTSWGAGPPSRDGWAHTVPGTPAAPAGWQPRPPGVPPGWSGGQPSWLQNPPPRRRSSVGRTALIVVLVAVLSAFGGIAAWQARGRSRPLLLDARSLQQLTPAGVTSYAFFGTKPDRRPVRWNPCAPIHWVANFSEAPQSGAPDVVEAFDRLAAASGLEFVFDGETTEYPDAERPPFQPNRYGKRWAPILVAWGSFDFAGIARTQDTVGITLPIMVGLKGQPQQIVSAQVLLANDTTIPGGFRNRTSWGAVILHELGHAVGLAHVPDPYQLMYFQTEESFGIANFGAGDKAGLALLGQQAGCLKPVPAQNVRVVG